MEDNNFQNEIEKPKGGLFSKILIGLLIVGAVFILLNITLLSNKDNELNKGNDNVVVNKKKYEDLFNGFAVGDGKLSFAPIKNVEIHSIVEGEIEIIKYNIKYQNKDYLEVEMAIFDTYEDYFSSSFVFDESLYQYKIKEEPNIYAVRKENDKLTAAAYTYEYNDKVVAIHYTNYTELDTDESRVEGMFEESKKLIQQNTKKLKGISEELKKISYLDNYKINETAQLLSIYLVGYDVAIKYNDIDLKFTVIVMEDFDYDDKFKDEQVINDVKIRLMDEEHISVEKDGKKVYLMAVAFEPKKFTHEQAYEIFKLVFKNEK